MAAGSIEDKLDKYYDDLMAKSKQNIEIQSKVLGENKELKKEVSRLREVVIQIQAELESLNLKLQQKINTEMALATATANAIYAEKKHDSSGPSPACSPVIDPAPSEPKKPSPKTLKEYLADGVSIYDVKVLNGFIKATKEVIKANCRTEPVFLKPRLENNENLPIVVAGKMKLSRDKGQGAMAVAFELKSMECVTRDVLFLDNETIPPLTDCKDVTSELCNQIVGRSKIILRTDGYNFDISLPTVFASADSKAILKELGIPKMALAFEYQKHPFYVVFWG